MRLQNSEHQELRRLYESYLDACNAHDFDRMASFYTPQIRVNDVAMDPSTVAAQFEPIVSAFPDWHWDVRNIAIDRDLISLHFTVTGTHKGTFEGIAPTGRRVSITEFTLYRVEDGKFAYVWDLADMAAIRQQIEI
ncbi:MULTISPECIES: ester cyclase [Mycobacterium]|nr:MULTISPECIES: ester cyclase [Mycobacterium]MDM4139294.1 ester cyclase [Mycobacterium sp. FLAC0960]